MNQIGCKGNRFTDRIKKLAAYMYIRGGKFFYNFLSVNLKLPVLKTLQRFMKSDHPPLEENLLDFDGLKDFIEKHQCSNSIGLYEDGAKIDENVKYIKRSNSLIGLTAPFDDSTGMPIQDFHKADSAKSVYESIQMYPKAGYVQSIIARPNNSHSPSFQLGYFFTDNTFNDESIVDRYDLCYDEFQKRGLKLLCFGTDGEGRNLRAQKKFSDFGKIYTAYGTTLAASLDSKISPTQCPEHLLKKMKNGYFSRIQRIGNKNACIGHLEILIQEFGKNQHGLTISDLNVNDRMNYRWGHSLIKSQKPNFISFLKKFTLLYLI
jgi:hypothetical protein